MKSTPTPFLKVTLGFGDGFARANDIYTFLNQMMHFQSATEFTTLMKVGHTVLVTGGSLLSSIAEKV